MQKENALQILASRVLCVEPDKYRVKVTNVNLFSRPDGTMVNIVGVAAMTPYLVQKAKETFHERSWQIWFGHRYRCLPCCEEFRKSLANRQLMRLRCLQHQFLKHRCLNLSCVFLGQAYQQLWH